MQAVALPPLRTPQDFVDARRLAFGRLDQAERQVCLVAGRPVAFRRSAVFEHAIKLEVQEQPSTLLVDLAVALDIDDRPPLERVRKPGPQVSAKSFQAGLRRPVTSSAEVTSSFQSPTWIFPSLGTAVFG